jgi:adenylosuccinate synthase
MRGGRYAILSLVKKLLASLGPVTAIIGAQWGDEGKGKVTDILGQHFDVIARACGGANAGHTIVAGGKKHVFHLLPAGCLHEGKPVILGSGMVIHLPTLLQEIETLEKSGVSIINRLFISGAAHIVLDIHKEIDALIEQRRGAKGIGTTKRGIGPAYMEKAARTGLRIECLREKNLLALLKDKAKSVQEMWDLQMNIDQELEQMESARKILGAHITESLPLLMQDHFMRRRTILIEGAQAVLLDIDHGTYPYVTSSATTSAGALQGLGMPPRALSSCIGVAKAYCTRVGSGSFATELEGERGDAMRERGGEYGSTTGRPRRVGWLHVPDLKLAAFINGFSMFNLTKLDVLDTEKDIPVGIGVDAEGKVIYETLRGWRTSTRGITAYDALPKEAQCFIEFIEKAVGVPIRLIGTGEGREEMIVR